MDVNDFESEIETIEVETEDKVEEKNEISQREETLNNALIQLENDVAIAARVSEHMLEAENERDAIEGKIQLHREQVLSLESELQLFIDQQEKAQNTLSQLELIGEDVSEGVRIYEERQKLIDYCKEKLQAIMEKLDMNPLELSSGNGGDSQILNSGESPNEKLIETYAEKVSSFKDRLKVETEAKRYDSIMGILVGNATLDNEYKKILCNRCAQAVNSENEVQRKAADLFQTFAQEGRLKVVDGEYSGVAYFCGGKNEEVGVYYNSKEDLSDRDGTGPGTTFYHEMGHMIDYVMGDGQYISSNVDFYEAIKRDARNIKRNRKNQIFKKSFDALIMEDHADSISDIMEGATNGEICGKFGHMGVDIHYWDDPFNLCNETFAHFFEAAMGGSDVQFLTRKFTKFEALQSLFPNAYSEFEKMISPAIFSFGEKVRERKL